MRYEFGENWQRFLKHGLTDDAIASARTALLSFLERPSLQGSTFLDIGSGSGLHSYCAFLAGAQRIVSFDYDPNSVEATRSMWRRAGSPAHWTLARGSVLDESFMATLGTFDIVYAWGVLHHTGDLWAAFQRAAACVSPGGRFFVALYDRDAYQKPSPEYWLDLKQRYNRASPARRRAMEAWYIVRFVVPKRPKNMVAFARRILDGKRGRGMSMYTDVRDWLGGWPMEFSTTTEVKEHARRHGLTAAKVRTGEGCAEYLFERAR